MKKKKWIVLILFGVLLISSAAYAADVIPSLTHEQLTQILEKDGLERRAQKEKELGKSSRMPKVTDSIDSYGKAIARAVNEKQRKEIEAIKVSQPSMFYKERAVKIILGELPSDQPRITEDQVNKMVKTILNIETDFIGQKLKNEINKIHGAPDYVYGSGLSYTDYVISENPPIGISISDNLITLKKANPKNPKENIIIDLIRNEVIATPEPSIRPN